MSSHINRRLWSQLWDPASFVTSALCKNPRVSFPGTTARRAFSWSRPRSQHPFPRRKPTVKSFASCGFLFLDLSPTASTSSTIASCSSTAEKSLYSANTLPRRSILSLAQQTWRREIHSSTRRRKGVIASRNKSSTSSSQKGTQNGNATSNAASATKTPPPSKPDSANSGSHNYLHLPHLPKMPHRPTKEELLAAATGFWSRLKVRFKWFSIRSVRPWNADDWGAFVSWFVLGNIVWIFVGTTTFFSLVIFSINTVFAQGKFYAFQLHCII